jgi:hypothetical protein
MDPDQDQEPVPDHPGGVALRTGCIPTVNTDAWNKLLATVGVSDSVASASKPGSLLALARVLPHPLSLEKDSAVPPLTMKPVPALLHLKLQHQHHLL